MKLLRAAALISLALASSACDAPVCEPLHAACDIRKAACQRDVFRVTACEREQSGAHAPPVRVISRAQLRKELEAEAAASKPTAQDQAWDRASQLLGFLPAAQSVENASVDLSANDIAAYYSSQTKDVTVIDDAAALKEDATLTLSHEYVHALQDQRDHLDDIYATHLDSTDSMIALDALFEGEATLLSMFVMARSHGKTPEKLALDGFFERLSQNLLDDIDRSPSPLLDAAQSLPYPVGGRPLYHRYEQQGGMPAIADLYRDPYTTLSRWITTNTSLPAALDCDDAAAPAGHVRVLGDRLGMAGLLALDVVSGAGTKPFTEHPERWAADHIAVFASKETPPKNVALAWRIRLDTEADAKALQTELAPAESSHFQVHRQGREVLIGAAESATVLSAWSALSECAPPSGQASPKRLGSMLQAARLRGRTRNLF